MPPLAPSSDIKAWDDNRLILPYTRPKGVTHNNMTLTSSQLKYSLSEKGKLSRQKYLSSEKAKQTHRAYLVKRKAQKAEAKPVKEIAQVNKKADEGKIKE